EALQLLLAALQEVEALLDLALLPFGDLEVVQDLVFLHGLRVELRELEQVREEALTGLVRRLLAPGRPRVLAALSLHFGGAAARGGLAHPVAEAEATVEQHPDDGQDRQLNGEDHLPGTRRFQALEGAHGVRSAPRGCWRGIDAAPPRRGSFARLFGS